MTVGRTRSRRSFVVRRNRTDNVLNHFSGRLRGYLIFAGSVLVLVAVWQIAASIVGLDIILPRPASVLRELVLVPSQPGFLQSLEATIARGISGFLLSAAVGFAVGLLTGLSRNAESAFRPVLTLIQSTPVMSVILLALIWFQTGGVPVFVAFLMSFPVIALNVGRGVREVDPQLVEMAKAFKLKGARVLGRLYIPSLSPYLVAAASISVGLTWRVVIAAEVLSQPVFGIGTQLQQARVELETARVFAWTAVAVILTGGSDLLFYLFSRLIKRRRDSSAATASKSLPKGSVGA